MVEQVAALHAATTRIYYIYAGHGRLERIASAFDCDSRPAAARHVNSVTIYRASVRMAADKYALRLDWVMRDAVESVSIIVFSPSRSGPTFVLICVHRTHKMLAKSQTQSPPSGISIVWLLLNHSLMRIEIYLFLEQSFLLRSSNP